MSIHKGSSKWYRILEDGTIERKTIGPNQPAPVAHHGERVWSRGIGPTNAGTGWQSALKGVPKTLEHREKMRQAKLGIPKTEAQRAKMKATHLARNKEVQAIQQELNVEWHEACKILKERKNA